MPGNTTNKRRGTAARENALAEVSRRYLQGEPQYQIAAALGVVQSQITYDLHILRKRWQQASLADITEAKGRELAKLDQLELTFWEAWERSRSERTVSSAKRRGDAAETSLRKEQRDGNPAFLEGVLKCVQQRCRIWGLETMKVEHSGPGGGPIPIVEVVVNVPAIIEGIEERGEQ